MTTHIDKDIENFLIDLKTLLVEHDACINILETGGYDLHATLEISVGPKDYCIDSLDAYEIDNVLNIEGI